MAQHAAPAASSNRGAWMALTAALLGWMFDGAEMGIFSLVGRSALQDLLPGADETAVGGWFGVITAGFLVGAATGGVLFGWLGDRIGRVRAMTLSVLTYALFTGLCGFSQEAWHVGALRFIAALGMGGEWSLGVALVMEVWPNRSRAFMAGLIGAAANVGYLLVALVQLSLNDLLGGLEELLLSLGLGQELAAQLVANRGWRIMMMLGTLPALLTFFIRIFVPESSRWEEERQSGRTSHWATVDLLGVVGGALGPVLIIWLWAPRPDGVAEPHKYLRILGTLVGLVVVTYGYLYPVRRFLQRQQASTGDVALQGQTLRRMLLAAALAGVALLGTWGSLQWAPSWAGKLAPDNPNAPGMTQLWSSLGAIVGTLGAALLGDWLGRRLTYSLMCVAALASTLLLYQGNSAFNTQFLVCVFIGGCCTASFYGWLPLYLPELFRTQVRATGQGFGFNFGRILAAVGALQTGNLMNADSRVIFGHVFSGGYPFACSVISVVYLLGFVAIAFAPETKGQPLPD